MSQPPVTAYFNTRKRQATDDLHGKSKVLLLEQDQSDNNPTLKSGDNTELVAEQEKSRIVRTNPKFIQKDTTKTDFGASKVVRKIQFDSSKTNMESRPRARVTRSHKSLSTDGQMDIRNSLQKMGSDGVENKNVRFEKKGMLSPNKSMTPTKSSYSIPKDNVIKEVEEEPPAFGSLTPTRRSSKNERQATESYSFEEVRNKIKKSSRLTELRARIARYKKLEQQLEQKRNESKESEKKMQKFEKIELEIPVSPQKGYKSPTKALQTPTKNELLQTASPQRRILLEPKETTPSPVKSSPNKKAHQKYFALSQPCTTATPALTLPRTYIFLAEVFRCVETASAMLFNRKELITFNKLKPAVQEMLHHDFTLKDLAQIKTIYPDAYTFHQEKHRKFGSISKQEKYELVLTPVVEKNNGRNTPDADNVLKSASNSSMGPTILLERKRKFYNILLARVKDEHEKFLQNLNYPIVISKEKIFRWHPEFDVDMCKDIEQAELPQPPQVEKITAKDVLDKTKSLFNCGSRMEKALQRMAEAKMTSKSSSPSSTDAIQTIETNIQKVNIAIVDTPPATPSIQTTYLNKMFKGIPKALLEKVRAKQAAKALEAMTRTPTADKEALLYSRLPELAKVLRNIFIAEKKNVLSLEVAMQKLDNSFKTKLTSQEMEEHIRVMCKLLPTWISIRNVEKIDYLKLDRNSDIITVMKKFEILIKDKVKMS